ncbi:MAG: serine/threonine-protein kinase [Myxococcota bacterium]
MSQTFGKYQLEKKLATGGMAEVWLAKQTGIEGFQRHVVIKRILPHLAEDPEFVQMFLNEAKIASRFNHPNIAQIYDLGEQGGTYFIAMEFIHGEDLGRVMRRAWSTGQWVARHIALRVIADTCGGLHYAHTRNDEQGQPLRVVHRDISPQNILISFDGAVKLVDFGIAKAADQVSMTKSGAIKGKFAYMAPEQAAGKPLDGRTDIFALGLVLYELITGVRPLKRDSELATLQAALECKIELPSNVAEVPPDLDEVVMRALTKAPDDRYRDAREFQKALEQYLLSTKELATSVEVSELMEMLFADRLAEERRLGAPNPSTESSTANPIPPSYNSQQSVTQPPPKERSPPPREPPPPPPPPPRPSNSAAMTMDEDADAGEETIGPGDEQDADQNDDEEFSIPAGTVVPSRRYVKPDATVAARASSRVDVTRAQVDVDEPRPSKVKRKTGAVPTHEREGEPASMPRRKSTGQFKRRTSSGTAMPEAPPRRSRPSVPVSRAEDESAHSNENISKLVDVKGMRAQQQTRLKALVAVLALVGVVILGVVFKDNVLAVLRKDGLSEDGVPLRLSVITNPPTMVTVVPPRGVKSRQPLELGRTPINEQSGAFVGDTILLTNEDRGIHFEEVLEYGQPNEHKLIEHEFKESTVKIRTRPALKSAWVWRGTTRLGQVNLAFGLVPGVHSLEIRSDQLIDPVPFELRFTPGQRVVEQEVDVSAALEKKQ